MADGEMSARDAEHVEWDVIVVGTGMGGGMLGYRLARSGRRVLFVEKGRSTLPGTPGTIRSAMPELAEPLAARSAEAYYDALARAGRSTDEVEDISGRFPKRFVPFIGSGTGGSSALYGMVCERFFVDDFTPRKNFPAPGDSTVPDAWPVTYDQMAPWYAEAERLLGVRGQPDPLRPEAAEVGLPAAPPFSADNQPLVDYLAGRGLHPYHLPMACDYTQDCTTCQTYLCDRSCKNDAALNCVLPAVTEHGAAAAGRLPSRAPGGRPHPGPAGDLRTPLRHAGAQGQGGGAGRRCAGHPGAVAQFPFRRLAARTGQRLGLGGTQPDASSARADRDLAAIRQQDHGREQGDRAQRLLFLRGAEIRHRAVLRRDTSHGVAGQPPRTAGQGAAPDEPGSAPDLRAVLHRRNRTGRDDGRPALSGQPGPAERSAERGRPPTGANSSIVCTPARSNVARCFCAS